MRKRRMKLYRHRSRWLKWLVLLLGLWALLFLMRDFQQIRDFVVVPDGEEIILYRTKQNTTERMPFEAYIIGVVAAEMPASYNEEALKAQAVCARSYTYHHLLNGYEYPMNADVSDNPGTCQAYVSKEEFTAAHEDGDMYYEKVKRAVLDTAGEILLADEQPLEAFYHSTCGGQTDEPLDVWGKEIPGIHSVNCPWCKKSPYYVQKKWLSTAEFSQCLGLHTDASIEKEVRTAGNRVQKMLINGREFSGEAVRKMLHLPSCWFQIQPVENGFFIITRGFGHGLGLCQVGAGGMADAGYSYVDILMHYYRNTELCCFL